MQVDTWHDVDTFESSVNTPRKPPFTASRLPVAHRGVLVPLHLVAASIQHYTRLRFLTSWSSNSGKQMLRKIIVLISLTLTLVVGVDV